MLEHEADIALTGALRGDVAAIEQQAAAVGEFEAGQDAQEGRLARSGRSQQRDELAARGRQIDAFQRLESR